jgi:hypothetical protein
MSNEFIVFFKQLITSWQVIAVAVAVLLYILLVNYVANFHPTGRKEPKSVRKVKSLKITRKAKQSKSMDEAEDDILKDE